MEKKRIDYIDACKFIGIFLVTFSHILERGLTFSLIYSFHVPLFFILTGYTLNVDMPFKDYLWKKIKSYIVPLFFMDILSILVYVGFALGEKNYNLLTTEYFLKQLVAIFEQRRNYALWFIASLFVSVLFAYPICKAGRKYKFITLILASGVLAFAIFFNKNYKASVVWNIDASFFGIFFVAIGYLFRWVNEKIPWMMSSRLHASIFALVLTYAGLTLAYVCLKKYNLHLEMWGRQYEKYYLVLPSAVITSIGVIFWARVVSNPVFNELGKGTIVVLALQQTLGQRLWKTYIVKDYYQYVNTLNEDALERVGYALGGVLFTLVISYAVYYLIVFSPLAFTINQKQRHFIKKQEVA